MRSTITRSFAAVTLGAALSLAPVGAAFADDHDVPDYTVPHSNEANQSAYYEAWLLQRGIEATCTKLPGKPADPFIVPAQPSEDQEWSLVVIKGGAGDGANELYLYPQPGWELSHRTAGNSHVIVCTSDVPDETTTTTTTTTTSSTTTTTTGTSTTGTKTTTTKPATGPVVETDRPAGGDFSGLGLLAGLGVAAAAGGVFLNRRRQSAEH